jgi:geranylgeranylglycerol-phosphate geranylgeranyltransferase
MLDKLKSYLESIHITPISWLAGVSGVLMVRFFLESLSNPTSSGYFASDASTLINYYLFFIATLLVFMVFFQIVVPSWKSVAPQFVALSSAAVLIAPIIDWVASEGRGLKMTYLFNTPKEMIYSLFHFFTGGINGVTIGLRIEITLGLLFFGLFVYFVEKNWKRAVISSLVLYLIVFLFASIPGIISIIGQTGHLFQNTPLVFLQNSITNSSAISNNIHSSLQYSSVVRLIEIAFNFIMGKILLLISVAVLLAWFYTSYKEKFKAVIRNSRAERIASYVVMVLFGIFVAYMIFPSIKLNWNDWLSVIMLCLSFYFSCLFAICANDMADEDTDKISNADRPLISNSLSKADMKQMGAVFIVISLISGFLAGYTSFFFILTFTALYYIYSVPPTRFKLVPFFSSFLIGLCMLSAIIAGFFLVSPVKYVSAFPGKLILAIVIIFSLLANVRDMKDVAGDRAAGIKTVPVIFGDIWGPRVVAIFAALSFVLIPIFSGIYVLFFTAVPTALASWYYINKKPYSEKPLDKIYFVFMFVSFLLLFV